MWGFTPTILFPQLRRLRHSPWVGVQRLQRCGRRTLARRHWSRVRRQFGTAGGTLEADVEPLAETRRVEEVSARGNHVAGRVAVVWGEKGAPADRKAKLRQRPQRKGKKKKKKKMCLPMPIYFATRSGRHRLYKKRVRRPVKPSVPTSTGPMQMTQSWERMSASSTRPW